MTTPAAPAPHASDLARRISMRREELGMSVQELSTRAGIDPGYLAYFESSPDANLSGGSLLLIALALDTTPFELLGGSADRPLGHARAMPHASLDELTPEQCRTHLSVGGVGRIVFSTERGPVALPVNFEFTEDQIVFSTDDAKASALGAGSTIGFEIDRIDEALSEGWSVLVTGSCRRIEDPEEVQRLSSLDLEAWAGGDRHALMAIAPVETTGRVIVHENPPDED
ncbi:MAG: helix-turn-helix domain-containing protein [Acidimicrobiales bacterium]|jgi:nitroimidazol reductase NimA-like FMN-containing flavoprotein (pyridoxamine 5'-phosphate oxidase superfamily)